MPWGGFTLVRELRRGGEGDLYEVRRERPDGFVQRAAVKVLRLDGDERARARFGREARLLGLLSDPGIVRILDYGVEDGRPYQVLELLHGEDLDRLVARRGALEPRHALSLLAGAAAAVHALHEARDHDGRPLSLFHNDLAPANLVVSPLGQVKLVDLGHAGDPTSGPETVVHGRRPFLAPERLRGGAPTAAIDVFALGAILGFSCLGRSPFEEPSAQAHLLAGRSPLLPSGLPEPIAALVRRACHPDPRRRHEDAAELATACEAAAEGLSAPAASLRRWLAADPAVVEPDRRDLGEGARRRAAMQGLFELELSVEAEPPPRSVVLPAPSTATEVVVPDVTVDEPGPAPSVRPLGGRASPRWTTIASVGRRGLGEVWVALDGAARGSEGGPLGAIRMLKRFDSAGLPRDHLERELTCAARLEHPGVLRPIAHDLTGDHPFAAFEYHLGRSLGRIISDLRARSPGPSLGFVVSAGLQAAEAVLALGRARGRAALPEDFLVQPGGLFVSADRRILVRDLAIATLTERASLAAPQRRVMSLVDLIRRLASALRERGAHPSPIERALGEISVRGEEGRLERARAHLAEAAESLEPSPAAWDIEGLYRAELDRERAWLGEAAHRGPETDAGAAPSIDESHPAHATVAEEPSPLAAEPPTTPLSGATGRGRRGGRRT